MQLISAFHETARRYPDKVALINEQSQLSFSDLLALAQACEAGLLAHGLRPRHRVVLTSDRPEFVLAFALLLSRHALTVVFAPARAVLAAAIEFDLMVGTEACAGLPPERQIVLDPAWFAAPLAAARPEFSQVIGDGGQFVFATSGTTGTPKFVAYSEALAARSYAGPDFKRADPATPAMRLLITAAMATTWGLLATLRVLLAGGSAVALAEHRNRPLQYIDLYAVSHLETTPVVIRQMLDVAQVGQYIASLRSIVVGGAFTSTELMERLAALTAAPIDVAYGTSEFGALALARFDRQSPHGDGYLGEIFRGDIEIGFFDETLRLLPGANEGIVGFRQPQGADVPKAYLGAGGGDARTGFIGGYFFPGDVMRRVGNHLYLIGRVKNVINVGGNKISLEAVQVALEAALDVQAVACLATPDALGLEELVMVYVGQAPIAAEAAQAVLDQGFPGVHLARILRRDSLPANASGKIDLEALRRDCL